MTEVTYPMALLGIGITWAFMWMIVKIVNGGN